MWGVQKQGLIALQSTPRRPAQHTEHHHLVSPSPPIITLLATEESTRQISHLALTVSTFGVNVGRTCGTNAPRLQAPIVVACSSPTSHAIARNNLRHQRATQGTHALDLLLRHWLAVRLTENAIDSTPVHNGVFRIYDSLGISLTCFLFCLA